ncbi:MAG: hypothetical protein MI975_13115 [Cytophagales bacterium]|nr:hypothetical protein [Cytophagales bacterium]
MKKAIFSIILIFQSIYLFAQLIPAQNSAKELKDLRVKSSSTYYVGDIDGEERLIFRKEFDNSGKLLKKYQLSLWDAVSYQHTTTYSYNDKGLLDEEQSIQEFLELYERDKNYLSIFGDKPLKEKKRYHYNDQGLLNRMLIYSFEENGPDSKTSANQTVVYQYENGLLAFEESASSDKRFFNKNYLIEYSYDSANNLVQKSMAYGVDKEMQRDYIFRYNEKNLLIEEQVVDASIPHNNDHLRYEYNDHDQLERKYIFDKDEKDFVLETTYSYDKNGNTISGDREVKFEYYENDLIKSESWTDPTTDQKFTFITKYDYF